MHGFHTKFEPDEEIVYGPLSTPSVLGNKAKHGLEQITVTSRESMRKVAVTNQRVIVEVGSRVITIPNHSVESVFIKRQEDERGIKSLTLNQVDCSTGQSVKLNIPNLKPEDETLLRKTFRNAEIKEKVFLSRGCWLALGLAAGLPVLCALVTYILSELN